jgi:hypothetical protein
VTVVLAGYSWPPRDELWPRLFVLSAGLILGALVAAAAHEQISGAWPAFIFGAGAPSTIQGILSGVEVGPLPTSLPDRPAPADPPIPSVQPEEGEIREDAP